MDYYDLKTCKTLTMMTEPANLDYRYCTYEKVHASDIALIHLDRKSEPGPNPIKDFSATIEATLKFQPIKSAM